MIRFRALAGWLCGFFDDESDRPVVRERYFHVSLKNPALNGNSECLNVFTEKLVECFRGRRCSRLFKAGASSSAAVAVECELADDQDRAFDVLYAQVHFAISIGKGTEVCAFVRDEAGDFGGIPLPYPEQNQPAWTDAADDLVIDRNLAG